MPQGDFTRSSTAADTGAGPGPLDRGSTVLIGGFRGRVVTVSRRGDGGQRVVRLERPGGPVLIKFYGRKRPLPRAAIRQFGSLFLVGKSSVTAAARCRTEAEVLRLWAAETFDVPALIDLDIPEVLARPHVAMEWVPGEPIKSLLRSGSETPFGCRAGLVAAFAAECGRRHARALELKEPRLLYEHPTLEHVIVSGERMVHIDFEIVFRSTRWIENLVQRELVGFLRSIARACHENLPELVAAFVAAYPHRARLEAVRDDLLRFGTVPVGSLDWLRKIPGNGIAGRLRRRDSYDRRRSVALALQAALAAPAGKAPECSARS